MLQKKKYITSTTRFASVIRLKDFTPKKTNFFLKKKKNRCLSKKIFFNRKKIGLSLIKKFNISFVVKDILYNKKPYQMFINAINLFNQDIIISGVEFMLPGKKFFDLTKNILFKKIKYLGSFALLEQLPYSSFICGIVNNYNNKITFVKSSGSYAIKLKGKKTVKLILIKLPSGFIYLFFKKTMCSIGKNTNFLNNKFIEGK